MWFCIHSKRNILSRRSRSTPKDPPTHPELPLYPTCKEEWDLCGWMRPTRVPFLEAPQHIVIWTKPGTLARKKQEWLLGEKRSICHRNLSSVQTTGGLKKSALRENVAFCKDKVGAQLFKRDIPSYPLETSGIQKNQKADLPSITSWADFFFNFISLLFFVFKRGL